MEHAGGKKERRSQKDRAKARRQKHGPPAGKKKTRDQKAVGRGMRQQQIEQGAAGLAGAGRAGPHKSKKTKSQQSKRKQKHKGKGYEASEASIARVASAFLKRARMEWVGGVSATYSQRGRPGHMDLKMNAYGTAYDDFGHAERLVKRIVNQLKTQLTKELESHPRFRVKGPETWQRGDTHVLGVELEVTADSLHSWDSEKAKILLSKHGFKVR